MEIEEESMQEKAPLEQIDGSHDKSLAEKLRITEKRTKTQMEIEQGIMEEKARLEETDSLHDKSLAEKLPATEKRVHAKKENEKGKRKMKALLEEINGLENKRLATELKHCIKTKRANTVIACLDENAKLEQCLQDKRYLIVIDDIWTIRAWDAIRSILPENNCASRIIVTTRIESVAKACSNHIHHMKPLTPKDSKELFLSRVYGCGSAPCPTELDAVIDDVLKKCGGLPLAIVSIASVFASYKSSEGIDKLRAILKSIGSQMESHPTLEGMKQIITLSYNQLHHELKSCMMYLSNFPEDYEIHTDRLLSRWIAEGLVMEKRGLTVKEVAQSYLDELVSRNMVMPVRFGDDGKLESCRVHDMLLEVIVSKSLECNFVSLLGGQYASMTYDRMRRLSIQGDENERTQSVEQPKKKTAGHLTREMDVEHVRSLSMFQHGGQNLLDHMKKFTLLRVLDLEGCLGLTMNHMIHICTLYLLRFLSLKGTDIKRVPGQIEKLEHLQTFDVRDTPVRGLPNTVKKLHKLERLQINYNSDNPEFMWRLPRGLNKMKALREVGFAFLGDIHVAQQIGELEQLQELSVYVDDQEGLVRVLSNSLSKLYSLRRLVIGATRGYGRALNFLRELREPPQLLRYLMIDGGMHGLPTWVSSLTNLVHLEMSLGELVQDQYQNILGDDLPKGEVVQYQDQVFDILCHLPNLKTISIQDWCHKLVALYRHWFPALTRLNVVCSNGTPNVLEFEYGSMAKLETLLFNFGGNKKYILGIKNLTSLKEVHLYGRKDNSALENALEELKYENEKRLLSSNNQFQIVVKYE